MDHVRDVLASDRLAEAARVVLISFVRDGLEDWQTVAGVPLDKQVLALVDEDRKVYKLLGLVKGSTWSIWQPKVLFYYMKRMLKGRELHSMNGDPHQLGGDFLVSPNGELLLEHPSQDPTDRPTVDQICHVLESSL